MLVYQPNYLPTCGFVFMGDSVLELLVWITNKGMVDNLEG